MFKALEVKAALNNIVLLTKDQIAVCSLKGVAHSNKPLPNSVVPL